MEANENMPVKFFCNFCDYGCCKKSSWTQHLLTSKHTKAKNGLMPANKIYACENCDKKYLPLGDYWNSLYYVMPLTVNPKPLANPKISFKDLQLKLNEVAKSYDCCLLKCNNKKYQCEEITIGRD